MEATRISPAGQSSRHKHCNDIDQGLASLHPDKVSCIYADNPGGNREMLARLGALATNDVPLLHVCGSLD